ncbi:restriction endonuclease subunit S [Vibrio sp. 10N.286.49.F3]|uniref:restriction endonuclease subunit S n=1 Tax=Vibrio sp. 10N.286.49.F3 TaxID=3229704 RepID=UPI00354CCA78
MSWPTVKLSELCEINIGKTPARANNSYWGEGYPWLSIADMSQGRNLFFTKEEITSLAVNETKIKLVKKGTVLFSFKLSIGKLGIATRDLFTNEAIAALPIKDKSRLCEEYLIYAMSQIDAVGKTDRAVMGATLNKKKLAELEIPLPPLAEQKRIAAILDKADAIRQKRKQAIDLADEFLRSVFLDMFGDPVTNPKGWEVSSLSSVADVITGFAFKSSEYVEDSETSVRLCRGANTLVGHFDWKDTAYYPKSHVSDLDKYLLEEGDIVLAMDRPWISSGLKVCMQGEYERDTYLVQRVARIRANNANMRDYLHSCILSKSFETHCCPTETTVPHISPVELKNFGIMLPSSDVIERYGNSTKVINELKRRNEVQLVKSNDMFNSLSQKAFSGEL